MIPHLRRRKDHTMNDKRPAKAGLSHTKSILLLLSSAALWSLGGILIKWIPLNAMALASWRSIIAILFLLAVVRRPRFHWSWWQLGGAAAYAVTLTLFVAANKLTSAANAILLQYTAPIYVALLGAWVLKERTSWLDWATIAIAIGGMALFFFDSLTAKGLWGNVLALASGLSFALLVICLRRQKDGSPLESVFLGNIITALLGLPFALRGLPDAAGWGGLVLAGVFQIGLPYLLYTVAIKNVTAVEAIVVPVIEPILNPLWVFLAMKEVPGSTTLVGGAVVLMTVTVRSVIGALSTAKPRKRGG